jgi:hypothetical protein
MLRLLGRGGQGEVYLTEYRGTDGFTVPGRDEDFFRLKDTVMLTPTARQ